MDLLACGWDTIAARNCCVVGHAFDVERIQVAGDSSGWTDRTRSRDAEVPIWEANSNLVKPDARTIDVDPIRLDTG
jgi:hypothetical protein